MKQKTIKNLLLGFFLLLLVTPFITPKTNAAATATLYMSPSSITRTVGNSFTANVNVNTGGQAANAFEATINVPTNILAITSASSGGSLCTLFVQQPTVTGSTVSFKCGVPNGYNGNSKLISIGFRGNAPGVARVTINNARVLANDGMGTNILSGTGVGTYTIIPEPPAPTRAPGVTSSTHPDQDKWYNNSNPALSWNKSSDYKGYSYVFDQNPGTVPPETINKTDNSISFNGKSDGIWYFHIRASGANGWSYTTHFRVQIDTGNPSNLQISVDPPGVIDRRPMISFNAIDSVSGIDRYGIRMDEGPWETVKSPYIPSSINSGDHVFYIRVFDKAGNKTEGSVKVRVKEIAKPKITEPKNHATLKMVEQLTVSGKAEKGTVINLYFDGIKINDKPITVDSDGKWSYKYEHFILPGKHKVVAVALKDGIESKPSDTVNINVDPSAVSIFGFIIPSYFIFLLLLIIIGLLILLLGYVYIRLKHRFLILLGKVRRHDDEVKKEIEVEYDQIEKQLRREIDETFETSGLGKALKAENSLEEKVEDDIEKSEERLKSKVSGVEKVSLSEEMPKLSNPLKAVGGVKDKARQRLIDVFERPEEKKQLEEEIVPRKVTDLVDEKYHGQTKNEDFPDKDENSQNDL
jgi:hypothetical protein